MTEARTTHPRARTAAPSGTHLRQSGRCDATAKRPALEQHPVGPTRGHAPGQEARVLPLQADPPRCSALLTRQGEWISQP